MLATRFWKRYFEFPLVPRRLAFTLGKTHLMILPKSGALSTRTAFTLSQWALYSSYTSCFGNVELFSHSSKWQRILSKYNGINAKTLPTVFCSFSILLYPQPSLVPYIYPFPPFLRSFHSPILLFLLKSTHPFHTYQWNAWVCSALVVDNGMAWGLQNNKQPTSTSRWFIFSRKVRMSNCFQRPYCTVQFFIQCRCDTRRTHQALVTHRRLSR